MDKCEIREYIKKLKKRLSDTDKVAASECVFSLIENSGIMSGKKNVMMYYSLPDELPTHKIIEQWSVKSRIFLPRVNGSMLDIVEYDASKMEKGAYGIQEPKSGNTYGKDEIDVIVVPAVAFDLAGNRVGRGKGFYDRILNDYKGVKVGVGYDFQLLEHIDSEPHDIKMDYIVTPGKFLKIR